MKKIIVSAAMIAAAVAAPAAAHAQGATPVTGGHGSFYVEPYAGYMFFGEFAKLSPTASQSYDNAALFGVQAGYSFTPNWSLLGNFGYSKTNAELKIQNSTNPPTSGDLGITVYDVNLQGRLPFLMGDTQSMISPFAQVGVGAFKISPDFENVSKGPTSVAFNFGGGVDFQLTPIVGIRVMAKDYITSLDWKELDDVDNEFRADKKNNVAHNVGLSAGLNIGF
ncbi:MAG: outer membrane beta-barrel protein [Gemmatimonadaceae bacterium]